VGRLSGRDNKESGGGGGGGGLEEWLKEIN